jgi:hypothetical protein
VIRLGLQQYYASPALAALLSRITGVEVARNE